MIDGFGGTVVALAASDGRGKLLGCKMALMERTCADAACGYRDEEEVEDATVMEGLTAQHKSLFRKQIVARIKATVRVKEMVRRASGRTSRA